MSTRGIWRASGRRCSRATGGSCGGAGRGPRRRGGTRSPPRCSWRRDRAGAARSTRRRGRGGARRADRPGLVLHSETEIVLPGGRVPRSGSAAGRSASAAGRSRRRPQSRAGGRRHGRIRVRLEPGGPIDTLSGGVDAPDPLLAYREVLARGDGRGGRGRRRRGLPARKSPGSRSRQVAYLRRSDRLPLRVEIEGGVDAATTASSSGSRRRRRSSSCNRLSQRRGSLVHTAHEADPPHRPRGAPASPRPRLRRHARRGRPRGRLPVDGRPPRLRRDADRPRPRPHGRALPRGAREHARRSSSRSASYKTGQPAEGPPARARPALPGHRARADGALRPRPARARGAGDRHRAAAGRRATAPRAGTPAYDLGHGRRRWFGLDLDDTPKRFRAFDGPAARRGRAGDRLRRRAARSYYARNRYKRDFFDAAATWSARSIRARGRAAPPARRGRRSAWATAAGRWSRAGSSSASTSWSEWCGLRHDPSVFARVSALRDFALGDAGVGAVCAVGPPTRDGRARAADVRGARASRALPR